MERDGAAASGTGSSRVGGRLWAEWFDGLLSARAGTSTRRALVYAKHYVDRRFCEPVAPETMAGRARLSKYHFVRAFRRIFKQTPHRYLIARRIARARDVLQNYTTYAVFWRLAKTGEDDPELPKRKAAVSLVRFATLHPHNIAQKTEIIVEHFRAKARPKIGGRAKAMVLTPSRLHAMRYLRAFRKYIAERGNDDVHPLVAFSGTVRDPDTGGEDTEAALNQIPETQLPEEFATERYSVLIVADKYLTGFDQPLLHTMYVDKRLAGVQAVQALSRLNRTQLGKDDTFVLDFVNSAEDIHAAFQLYYE